MKKNCVLCFGLGIPIFAHVQTSESPKAAAGTNADGEADITSFKGSEKIVIRRLGCETTVKSNFELEALAFELLHEECP
jgi:hypothetical protein